MRWQRCPWLLVHVVCVAVCLLLDYPICSRQQDVSGIAIYIENYTNNPDCNTFATLGDYFNIEAGKNITCPYLLYPSGSMVEGSDPPTSSTASCAHQPGSLPPNGSVSWCYTTPAYFLIGSGSGTLCFNRAGNRTVSFSMLERPQELENHINSITVLDDGRLSFPVVSYFFDRATIDNCTVFTDDGQVCGESGATDITLLKRTTSTIADERPSILSAPKGEDLQLNIGERLVWCVSGGSFGVHDLQWTWSQDPHLETVNISASVSDPPCLNCECAQSRYYSTTVVQEHLQNKTVGGARGVAFSVLGYIFPNTRNTRSWQCSGVPTNYLSFVIIDGVKHDDDLTELMFKVTSFTGGNTQRSYSIHASYKQFSPEFREDYFTQDPIQTPQQNYLYFCNASIPGDANLEWRTGSVLVQFTSSNGFSSRSSLSLTDIDNLCQEPSHNKTFAIRFDNSNLTDDSGALFHSQEIALVLCSDRRSQTPMTYTCYSTSNSSVEGPTASFPLPPSLTLPPSTSYHITATVVVIVIVVVIILLLIILIMYLRHCRLKTEPPRMCPVGSATASLIASTLAPFGLEPVESISFEFPRENLQFMKVLGEGQFGRVFKAIAEGICPYDSNRKIVAVKTLKENARPSDKDDLRSELATMRGMEPHPNILNYLGMCSETATDPLCILLEFAMYGSLKDYLKSVKTGKLPNPQLLLHQAPPIAPTSKTTTTYLQVASGNASMSGMTSSVYPVTNQHSTLNLCPYHHNQLTQHRLNGTTPNMLSSVSTGGAPVDQHHHHLCSSASVSLYDMDPASKAHAMRLLRLLNSKYYIQQLTDNQECCHDDTTQDWAATKSGQLVCSYCGLGEMCVRRACLDDYPHWYHDTTPRNDYYNSYYNYSEQQKKDDSGSSFVKTPESNLPPHPPPIYVNACEGEEDVNSSTYPQQELACHCESPPNLNPYYNYHLSSSSGCIYCHQYVNSEAVGGGACQQTGVNLGGAGLNVAATVTDSTETRLSYFEVLDFALQIARGMEHLEKMKCVHRDLAARNVLIAEGFLLKIGDFGLARDLSEKDYYRKITPGRVPARWMALESLEERTHTSKSDVWSYGVVLWEILTYGGLPYGRSPVASGIESLTAYIKAGHRLPKPPNCSEEMFGLLKMCWEEDPELRPSFAQLVNIFTTLLDSTKEYFSLSMEDAVHQPMTAHLEASAVAGISNSGSEREPLQPTILTSPYGTMGAPVHSTSCSYIDEPDSISPTKDNSTSVPMSPEPSIDFNLGPSLLDQVSAALSQDYLKLIDDSANHHKEQEYSNEGAVGMGNREPGTGMRFNQTTTTAYSIIEPTFDTSEKRNEHVVYYPPPDIVLESLSSQSIEPRTALGLDGVAGTKWGNQEVAIDSDGLNGRSKVRHGHSRTRQRNIHCLETEV